MGLRGFISDFGVKLSGDRLDRASYFDSRGDLCARCERVLSVGDIGEPSRERDTSVPATNGWSGSEDELGTDIAVDGTVIVGVGGCGG